MRRFGTIFPFLEKGETNLRLGRLVANHDFVKALLKHGTFDEYVFGNPSHSNIAAFSQAIEGWQLPKEAKERIRIVTYFDLPLILKENEFRVFHLGGWGYFAPGLHYLRARYASNPWPITSVTHSLTGRQSIDHAVRLCKAGMASYDSVFCTSRDGRQAMLRVLEMASSIAAGSFRGKLDCLPLGIDDDLLHGHGDRARAREQMRIPPQAIVILLLGRITPAQKMDLAPALSAMARLVLPRCHRPVYLVIGGGADNQNLKLLQGMIKEHQLEDITRIRANFADQAKADLLAGADIFLSVSDNHQETFGLSILEAQACALPTVASRFDGYKDLVQEGVDGFLIDSYGCIADPLSEVFDMMDPDIGELFEAQKIAIDTEQLSKRLIELIHNDSLRAAMGENGRRKVEREFVFSRIIARYEQRWDELFHEAAKTGLPKVEGLSFQADQSRIFGHYVSQTIQPTDLVVAQPGQLLCPSYNEVSVLLNGDQLKMLLHEAGTPIRVQDLLATVKLPHDRGWFMVMWLLKNDLLRLVTRV
jgi:glycosyltransferase involved in cell wall biosynthesis